MPKEPKGNRIPWPPCQYLYHTAHGAEQCPNDAYLAVTGLLNMETMLVCSEHACEAIERMGAIYHDYCDIEEDGPVLVRKLKEAPQPGRDD